MPNSLVTAISGALELDYGVVEGHLRGLERAGRGTTPSPNMAADLLCCCLSTDRQNATAAYHLPLVNAIKDGSATTPADAGLHGGITAFGQAVAGLIENGLGGQIDAIDRLEVLGRGPGLRAAISAEHADGSIVQIWFGYEMLPQVRLRPAVGVTALQPRMRVSGQIIELLRESFEAPSTRHRRQTAQRFLDRARAANTAN